MNVAPCEICGRENPIEAPKSRDKTHFSARILRALLAPLGRFFHALTALFCAFALWSMALHGVLPFLGWLSLGLIFSWLMVAGIWILRLGTRLAVWVFAPATRAQKRPGARTFGVLPVCLAVLTLLNAFDAPLRAAFWLSQSELERVKPVAAPVPTNTRRGVVAGPATPSRAGFYRARNIALDGKHRRIEVTNSDFIWSGTRAGFAKCPGGCQTAKFPPAYMRGEDPPTYLQLSRDWFWWEETGTDD